MSKTRRTFATRSKRKNIYADELGGPIKGKEIEFFNFEVKLLTPVQRRHSKIRKKIKKS